VGDGAWILLIVILLLLAGVIYGFFTRRGSGINQHRQSRPSDAPGGRGRSEVSGKDEGEGSALDTHGTR
jgi:hypothetical protein